MQGITMVFESLITTIAMLVAAICVLSSILSTFYYVIAPNTKYFVDERIVNVRIMNDRRIGIALMAITVIWMLVFTYLALLLSGEGVHHGL